MGRARVILPKSVEAWLMAWGSTLILLARFNSSSFGGNKVVHGFACPIVQIKWLRIINTMMKKVELEPEFNIVERKKKGHCLLFIRCLDR